MFYTTPARRAYYDSVVAFPEGTGMTATVQSEVVKSFETTAFGPARVYLQGTGTDANAHTMVSFDEGGEWHEVDQTSFANGFTDVGEVAKYAPRVRVDVDLNGQDITDADAWKVAVLTEEEMPMVRRNFKADLMSGVVLAVTETAVETVEIPEGRPEGVVAVVTADATEVTDTTVLLETSFDGENWWNLSAGAIDVSTNNVTFVENDDVVIGTYVRVTAEAAASTGAVTADAGLRVHLLSMVQ